MYIFIFIIGKGDLCHNDYIRYREAVKWNSKAKNLCLSLHGEESEEYADICSILGDD